MKSPTLAGLSGLALILVFFPESGRTQTRVPSFEKHRPLPHTGQIVVTDAPRPNTMRKIGEVPASPSDVEETLVSAGLARVDRALSRASASPATPIASSFAELASRVEPGERVDVTTCTGARIRAQIVAFSSSFLTLRVDGGLRRLSEAEVCVIERRRGDSIWNGVKNGAAIGVLGGLLFGVAVCDRQCVAEGAAVFLGGGMAVGAGLGAAIDANIPERVIIYRKSND
jgi:hypothetical protein